MAATPSVLIETTPIDENTIVAPKASVDANITVPPNATLIAFIAPSTHGPSDPGTSLVFI